MVYVKPDQSEEVTNVFESTRDGKEGIVVETNEGYFEYWFPYTPTPDYANTDGDFVLDLGKAAIRENAENPTEYDGSDAITIPESVVSSAEQRFGHPRLE